MFITGRNAQRGESAVKHLVDATGNTNIVFIRGDLSTLDDIDGLASDILHRTESIDVLINNAGDLGSEPCSSDDGVEMHFAVNVLAPWRLTHALIPALERGKSAAGAAQSTIWGATSPELDGVSGAYFDTHSKRQNLHPSAHDPVVQTRIRTLLEEIEAGR